ncbi:hypothetical protein [Bacteroides thetaiotaomicron]|uniref:hypothetical protein n=1 Tax=Bacteroides thetaiotaomicron TaxID=818 RepID=UPI0039C2C08B
MKKLLSITMLLISSLFIYAQQDVTKFLGIPVDGSKSEMIQKLKAKGYTSSPLDKDVLVGEFNGADVNIHVVTNNNKVYRIMICDVNNIDERAIQIRFNRLCEQFVNNSKYSSLPLEEYMIPDDEDISYEITVHKKRYEAVFYQKTDETFMAKQIEAAFPQYTKEQLANPSEELRAEIVNFVTQYISKKSCLVYD